MEQYKMRKRVAIIGGGPAGCTCAYYALKNQNLDITIFDNKPLLSTILPTGNGRCNFTNGEFDIKELAKNYPRGEKFLYSVFAQYSPSDTLAFFDKLGIDYYMQDDFRYFPKSNRAKDIQKTLSNSLLKNNKFTYVKEKISDIKKLYDDFDYVVVATGSNIQTLKNLENLSVPIIPFKQSLVALKMSQAYLNQIPGVAIKNVTASVNKQKYNGDILITHNAISGPLIYKISSIMAFEKMPYPIFLNFTDYSDKDIFFKDFEKIIKENNNKNIVNVVDKYIPLSLAEVFLSVLKIDKNLKCNQLNKICREKIANYLFNYQLDVIGTLKNGETVKAGGVNTDFIDSKSMKSKVQENLFVIGEMLNVDGYCGGFNLQNCWSTGAICGKYLANTNS